MAGVIASKVRKQRVAVKDDKEEDQVGTNYLNVGTNLALAPTSLPQHLCMFNVCK